MRIIDSHVHFWNTARFQYLWIAEGEPINRPFVGEDFRQAVGAIPVEGVVFVQADCKPEQGLDEARWVASLNAPVKGIVGFAPLEQGSAARGVLDALADMPLVKGVRRLIQWEASGFAAQPKFAEGVRLLADYDLPFDLCIFHYQFPDTLALVEQCPKVRFVLDHLGKPGIASGEIDEWRRQISRLAQHENVYAKLSGLVNEADHRNWQADQLRPYAEHALEVFGARRVMFGSDWPVATLATPYARWFETARQFVSSLAQDEQQQIFADNATRFYRLTG